MDVVENLEAFRAVVRHGGFTRAAEVCGLPQPVVSRRVAALESHLGVTLLDRAHHSVTLSEAGRRILPLADELLNQWRSIEAIAAGSGGASQFLVPPGLDPRLLASVRRGLAGIEFVEEDAEVRRRSWEAGRADLALLVVEPGPRTVDVPLGLACAEGEGAPVPLSRLRRFARDRELPARVVHVDAEDDVPAIRDTVARLAQAYGLRADQVTVGIPRAEAHTLVHERGDLLLCPRSEALRHGLAWSASTELPLVRAYALVHREDLAASAVEALRAKLLRAWSDRR
ncbi:MAG TPA: LysR family transcriptional regulator [Propionibacteriaceae bacterium]